MIDCNAAERIVSRQLDSETTEDEARRLDEHCAVCAACREYRAEQAGLHDALAAGLSGFAEAVRPAVRPRGALRRLAQAAAALALMFGSGLAGYHLRGESVEPQMAATPPGPPLERAEPAPRTAEPKVMVAHTEGEAERIVWTAGRDLHRASRIDSNTVYRVASPDGTVEIQWLERDSRYRLVGLHQ